MSRKIMRAARFYGPGIGLKVEEVPYPVPGPDEVVLKVAACGICGSDVHFLEGMPLPGPLPLTLGHEPSGVVAAVGARVRDWAPGDRVALHLGNGCGVCRTCKSGHPNCCSQQALPGLHIDGAFAEALKIAAASLIRVPDAVPLSAAAVATDCVATPYHALKCRAGLRPGERVAVLGVGGLGCQAVRLARLLGAEQVIAVDLSVVALERARRAGASAVVHVVAGEDPAERIRQITEGGADVVLECVGHPDTLTSGVRALVPGGRFVAVGVTMMPLHIDLPQAMFSVAELSLFGSFGSHAADLEEILRLQAAGTIDIEQSISHRLTLDQVPEGLEMLRSKKDNPQRIVVEMPQ